MNDRKTVWVVILNYNSSDDCRKCIADLQLQRDVDCRIVVIDNASSSDDLQRLRQICAGSEVILLENSVNNGYSAGNNIGLRYAAMHDADLVLIANPDMIFPDREYLSALCKVFNGDDRIVIAATDILNIEGWHQNPLPPDGRRFGAFDWVVNIVRKNRRPDAPGYEISGECRKVSGCCFMIKMNFLQEIGYFDEYPFLYCEEAILAAQVRRSGMKMYYLADRQALHHHIAANKGDSTARFKQFCRSRTYFQWHYTDDNCIIKAVSIASFRLWAWLMICHAKIKAAFV